MRRQPELPLDLPPRRSTRRLRRNAGLDGRLVPPLPALRPGEEGRFHPVYWWLYATTEGRLFRAKPFAANGARWRECNQNSTTTNGYVLVGGTGNPLKRSVVICEAFHGLRPPGMVVCHGPAGQTCDRPDNLSWGSPAQNARDKHRDGTMGAVLTAPDVSRILREMYAGRTDRQTAAALSVAPEVVRDVRRGRTWQHLYTPLLRRRMWREAVKRRSESADSPRQTG